MEPRRRSRHMTRLELQERCRFAYDEPEESSMTQTITAIFENGVFKPTEAVDLPKKTQVLLTVELLKSETQKQSDAAKEEQPAKPLPRRHMTREELNFRRSYD